MLWEIDFENDMGVFAPFAGRRSSALIGVPFRQNSASALHEKNTKHM